MMNEEDIREFNTNFNSKHYIPENEDEQKDGQSE
jgi:hypothetical protein